jgi:hypothetical protein
MQYDAATCNELGAQHGRTNYEGTSFHVRFANNINTAPKMKLLLHVLVKQRLLDRIRPEVLLRVHLESLYKKLLHLQVGTLQTGRSRNRFPMVSEFFIDIILPVALWPWGRLSL